MYSCRCVSVLVCVFPLVNVYAYMCWFGTYVCAHVTHFIHLSLKKKIMIIWTIVSES